MGKKKGYTIGAIAIIAVAGGAYAISHHTSNNTQVADAQVGDFKLAYTNHAKPLKDGTLNVGLTLDQPFTGMFAQELATSTTDTILAEPLGNDIFKSDDSFKIVDGGAANFKLDKATKTATITLRKGLTWSDGHPVVAKDLEFPYEIVGNPAYGGTTYADATANIKGMDAFHTGKAKTISGITYPDGQNGQAIKIQFTKLTPSLTQIGSGNYMQTVAPYHYYKNIKPADFSGSKQVRQAPLSWGPFKVTKVVAGQAVEYARNPYYYGAKPKLAKINLQVVSTTSIAAALKAKKFAVAYLVPGNAYPTIKNLADFVQTGQSALQISATYFNLGHFDQQKDRNIQDRKTPLQNKALRAAMGYALNTDQVNKKFNHGLQTRANTMIPTAFEGYNDKAVKGFPFDVKKADSLLDAAGFKWDAKHE
ncbi:hypothetical protein EQG49_01415 [Periweissella cryptocerci]|uniref:Solute-binding protein family 5 domain-containing protein n=1 Tax=Periweissella cryptocerci TaxID=2506420 RepID=A0A4P6YRE1_9LACO|nr:ABC transporter substrate-binding protein [Periweissella cryptocerci]QBO35208.1 hypothetical protein EQG49_01415 [Periweissella cryptocerci]